MNTDWKKKNLDILEQHLRDGCKLHCIQKLGVEIEHILVDRQSREAVTYQEEKGVHWILEQLSREFPVKMSEKGNLLGLANLDYTITLEPAAQLEISIAPKESIAVIEKVYESFLALLDPLLKQCDYELVTQGYQPHSLVDELPMIPKKRYAYMDDYFKTSGTRGRHMMRGTASAQISIDYCCEPDFIRKYRTVSILMPAIKLLSDNTRYFEGKPYKDYLARTDIWNHVDPRRCGILDGIFEENFGFHTYAEYLWNLPLIFLPTPQGSVATGTRTVGEIWSDRELSPEDVDHVLSMTFLDVRVKHYIEIRGADSMPEEYVLAYLALIKGIFFKPEVQGKLLSLYPVGKEDIIRAEQSLQRDGYEGVIYQKPAADFVRELLCLAAENLDQSEAAYLKPFEKLAERKMTLAKEHYESN
ncbi:MAG: glutamate-cysteine ligase family protein [Lachnospiraceae bacterium]|nr:glutamate-cysteine ligase family protein [Lachnospiraceae bacterium]